MIKMETSMGDIAIELDFDKAPKSAANFQQYVEDGFYDGLIFHRVINGFMIQGGGMDENMKEKGTRAPIENEGQQRGEETSATPWPWPGPWTRTPPPPSSSSTSRTTPSSTSAARPPQGWGYAVFGKVVDGTDVVDEIKGVGDRPPRLP